MIVGKVGERSSPRNDGHDHNDKVRRRVTGIEERNPVKDGRESQQPSSDEDNSGVYQNQSPSSSQSGGTEDRVTIDGGTGNDVIKVTQDKDGNLKVDVNGKVSTYTRAQARNMAIRGGLGNDSIIIDGSVTGDLTLEGGDGNDEIRGGSGRNTINGGSGNDRLIGGRGVNVIDGGDGRDYIAGGRGDDILRGGKGDDVIYGLGGNDTIEGGAGKDYLDGGEGNDAVRGGDGNDDIFGGRGNDILEGGKGTNVMAGGDGQDTIKHSGVKDRIYSQSDDSVSEDSSSKSFWSRVGSFFRKLFLGKDSEDPVNTGVSIDNSLGTNIRVNGTDEFKSRVSSDMDALRSIPAGKKMLESLKGSSYPIDIQETDGANNMVTYEDSQLRDDGSRGAGSEVTLNYNPSRVTTGQGTASWEQRPPVVGLYHELVHSYNAVTGTTQKGEDSTGAPNLENQAIGIANTGIPYDHDSNPSTPLQTGNPDALTENALRRELGVTERPVY
jgi:Ca2+-binding RTX toxin-like protein